MQEFVSKLCCSSPSFTVRTLSVSDSELISRSKMRGIPLVFSSLSLLPLSCRILHLPVSSQCPTREMRRSSDKVCGRRAPQWGLPSPSVRPLFLLSLSPMPLLSLSSPSVRPLFPLALFPLSLSLLPCFCHVHFLLKCFELPPFLPLFPWQTTTTMCSCIYCSFMFHDIHLLILSHKTHCGHSVHSLTFGSASQCNYADCTNQTA